MVSVIVPNYNHDAFLQQRMDSILSQTYNDYEVIILDDASTDKSRDIIETYRDNNRVVEIVYNAANSGSPFKQWQKGIQLAKGEYIWIAESDDYCDKNFLSSAVSSLESKGAGLHYCQSRLVDEHNNVLEHTLQWIEGVTVINWKEPFFMNGSEFIKKALQYRNVIPNASAVVFSKQYVDFEKTGLYKSSGDWLFWIKILSVSNISYSPAVLNSFRSHSGTTRSSGAHRKLLLRYFEELAIKYNIYCSNLRGDKAELHRVLKASIDLCSLPDLFFFINFCSRFRLPRKFVLKFFKQKLMLKS